MNRYIIFTLIIGLCILLTGCWNYRELNSIYIVSGIAIDKNKETGLYDISVEIVNIKDTNFQPNIESVVLEASGSTISGPITDLIKTSSKKLYWGHATTLIISKDVARDSVLPTLDWAARDQEPRLSIEVFISGEDTAKELLDTKSLTTDIRLFEIDTMVSENRSLIEMPVIKIYELINELDIPKTHSVLPMIKVESVHGNFTNVLSGGAILNKDKLVGYLSDEEILPFLFIRDNVNAGHIKLSDKNNPKDNVILEIFNSKTKIYYNLSEGNISFDINIETQVSIAELNTTTDYISKSGRKELKNKAEKFLQRETKNLIKRMQNELGLDIFGFGNIIRQRDPNTWKKIERDWDSIFAKLDINVNYNIHIRNSGHISKPIEVFK